MHAPDPQRIQATKAAGNLAINPTGPDSYRLDLRNYVKSGDTLSLSLDTARNVLQTVSVKSYLEAQADAVTLDVTFAQLRGGLSYPGSIVLNVPKEQIQSRDPELQLRAGHAGRAGDGASRPRPRDRRRVDDGDGQPDGPNRALPDALVAQILQASTDVPGVQKFAGWLKTTRRSKGSALQDAAQAAGSRLVRGARALPQVVQMLAEKPDWTQQLGRPSPAGRLRIHSAPARSVRPRQLKTTLTRCHRDHQKDAR
jgi:hypothetical protein